jgi:predicted secreted protein
MATLRGENVRICIWDSTLSTPAYKVIGMSTGCTITLTNNTDNSSHKDVVGMAAMPVTTSKSWQVSVDSLNVSDTAAILTAIKSMQPMTLMWDETSTTDNQTRQKATWARKGQAYLSDCTFTFDNRTNSTKQLQFSGTGPLEVVPAAEATQVIPLGSYTRGETVRLYLSSNNTDNPTTVLAAARSLSLHVSITLEDATTKDTDGAWVYQEPTELNYDITSGALVRCGESITSQVGAKSYADIQSLYEAGTPFKWKIANVSGANNRTASGTIVSGSILITTLTQNDPNRQVSDYTINANGYGLYEVAA